MSELEHTVYLIRHAHSAMNAGMADPNRVPFIGGRQNDVELDNLGKDQAQALGKYALREGIVPTSIYSSPAERTKQTNELSAAAMGLTVTTTFDDRLQELDQGAWTNQPRTLYTDPENKRIMDQLGSDFTPPQGESMNDVARRMDDFMTSLASLLKTDTTENVWVHTHGVAIKTYVGKLLGWSHKRTYKTPVDNVSMTRLTRRSGAWCLDFFNRSPIDVPR